MTIRPAKHYEISVIKHYEAKVRKEASMGYLQDNVTNNDELFAFENSFYLVSVVEGNLQGWILLGDSFDPNFNNYTGMILELYVFKPYRNKGIGKQLLTQALHYFKRKGIKRAQLNVFAGNPARKLYERLGFTEISRIMELPL